VVVYGSSRLGIAVKGRGDGERTWSLAQESNLETNFADVAMLPCLVLLLCNLSTQYISMLSENRKHLYSQQHLQRG